MAWHDWVLTGTSPCSSVPLGYSRSASAKPGWRSPLGRGRIRHYTWQRTAPRGSVYKGTHGVTHGVLTGVLTGYSPVAHGVRTGHSQGTHGVLTGYSRAAHGRSNVESRLVKEGSGSTGWCIALRRALGCVGSLTMHVLERARRVLTAAAAPPSTECKLSTTARVPGGPRLLFGIGFPHAPYGCARAQRRQPFRQRSGRPTSGTPTRRRARRPPPHRRYRRRCRRRFPAVRATRTRIL
jgi:hypothetical protein